ncbi:hypothetical protein ACRVZG_27305 (plasmid) [Bacillus tropicus]|uniref:hypothetical protein n=1 Tax=Bacillus tropicus TaxID=2026188 RepID=UPI000C2AEECC|nr:hypothetical protein CEW46_16460 [Bacillus cereus]
MNNNKDVASEISQFLYINEVVDQDEKVEEYWEISISTRIKDWYGKAECNNRNLWFKWGKLDAKNQRDSVVEMISKIRKNS